MATDSRWRLHKAAASDAKREDWSELDLFIDALQYDSDNWSSRVAPKSKSDWLTLKQIDELIKTHAELIAKDYNRKRAMSAEEREKTAVRAARLSGLRTDLIKFVQACEDKQILEKEESGRNKRKAAEPAKKDEGKESPSEAAAKKAKIAHDAFNVATSFHDARVKKAWKEYEEAKKVAGDFTRARAKSDGIFFLEYHGYPDLVFSDGTRLSSFVHLPHADRRKQAASLPDLEEKLTNALFESDGDDDRVLNMQAWLNSSDDDTDCLGWE